jgi:Pyruvate/2-oxoacid:ferredoxin oxidoreductase gamma subunit
VVKDFEIRFGGSGGQGLQLSAKLLADALILGVFSGLAKVCGSGTLHEVIRGGVPPRFVDLNLRAFARGVELSETAALALT